MTCRRVPVWLGAVVAIWCSAVLAATPQRFLADDPLFVDPESKDAGVVRPRTTTSGLGAELAQRLAGFGRRGGQRARNLNTIDEVLDSSWFTNRGDRGGEPPVGDVAEAEISAEVPAGRWTIESADGAARLPQLVAVDGNGHPHQITFDEPAHPELATGATMVTARLLHAAGYHVPAHWLERIRRDRLVIRADATVRDEFGRRRVMTATDLDLVLARAARGREGAYRAVVRREPDGLDLGPFSYAGTRPDDPNDLVPHEHRRELRGLRVFAAWLNHDAAAAFGTRDVLSDVTGRRLVRHFLVELGATLGSGTALTDRPLAGDEYAWRARSKIRTLLTLGLAVRPWSRVDYPELPSVGLFEALAFDPATWVPPYSNPAFDLARPDDLFWAARRVAAFGEAAIWAAVRAGHYSDPEAEAYLVATLIARRDQIARVWLNVVLPLVDCRLSAEGWLECSNIAQASGTNGEGGRYEARWYRFDNDRSSMDQAGEPSTSDEYPHFTAPAGLLDAGDMIAVEIRGTHPRHPGWATPMTVYVRRTADGWRTIGLERLP